MFASSTNTFGLPHSSQTPTIFIHPKNIASVVCEEENLEEQKTKK